MSDPKELEYYFRKHGIPVPDRREYAWLQDMLRLIDLMDRQIDDLQYKLAAERQKK